jgi:shikimate kinase
MLKKRRHIYLVGFSGSGKSTVGPILAQKLRRPCFDTDQVIEKQARYSVTELFQGMGEAAFRTLENKTIRRLAASRTPSVIALGGGALLKPANRTIVFNSGTVVYLRCSIAELVRRLARKTDRPLLASSRTNRRERLRLLINARRPQYERADLTVVTTNRTVAQTVKQIQIRLRRHHGTDTG